MIKFRSVTIAHANPYDSEATLAKHPEKDYYKASVTVGSSSPYGESDMKIPLPPEVAAEVVAVIARLIEVGATQVADAFRQQSFAIPSGQALIEASKVDDDDDDLPF